MLKLFLMGKICKFFLIFALLALISALIPQIVSADPPAPSSVTLVNYYATNNLLGAGDFFLLIDYNIAYSGGYPTFPASDAFTFRLFDPTGSTEIADALPYVFTTATTGFTGTNGYGRGVVAGGITTLLKFRETRRNSVLRRNTISNYRHLLISLPAIMPLI